MGNRNNVNVVSDTTHNTEATSGKGRRQRNARQRKRAVMVSNTEKEQSISAPKAVESQRDSSQNGRGHGAPELAPASPSSALSSNDGDSMREQAPQSKMCSQRAVAIIKAVLVVGFVAGLAAAAIGSAGLGLLPAILGFAKIGALSLGVSLGLTIGGGVSLLSAFVGGSYMMSKNGLFSKKAEGDDLKSLSSQTSSSLEAQATNTGIEENKGTEGTEGTEGTDDKPVLYRGLGYTA